MKYDQFLLLALAFAACNSNGPVVDAPEPQQIIVRDDLRDLYDAQAVTGSFILHDLSSDRWLYVDSGRADLATLPASTFKIFSTLYALETGIVKDASTTMKWDGTNYGRPSINKDLSLREAYDHSAYWFHRDVARMAGPKVLKHWLDTVGYGNADTTGGYDRCWVRGGLRITPREQVKFLERLRAGALPFSERTIRIAKEIMVREDTMNHVLRAKTGWAMGDSGSIGWYVGWVEAPGGKGPYFFANRVFTPDTNSTTFAAARISIAMEILAQEGIWPK